MRVTIRPQCLVTAGVLLFVAAAAPALSGDTMMIVDDATRIAILFDPETDAITSTVPLGFSGRFAGDLQELNNN